LPRRGTASARSEDLGGLDSGPLARGVVVRAPAWNARDISDATNYRGGMVDVLEQKTQRGWLDHLGELAAVALYHNDRQLRDVRLRFEEDVERAYMVVLSEL
jgi:hypothetical protein